MSTESISPNDPRVYHHGSTVVLGIDPSAASTGYGVVCGDRLIGAGCISTFPEQPEQERLWVIFSEVVALIQEFGVQHVAAEHFVHFFRSEKVDSDPASVFAAALQPTSAAKRKGRHQRKRVNPKSMFLLKAAQTAVQLAALASGVPLFLYKVAEWKGGAGVTKNETMDAVPLIYGVTIDDHDICDGIMIANHHVTRGRFRPEHGYYVPAENRKETLLVCSPTKPDDAA